MSAARVPVPRSAWLAVGAAVAAGWAWAGQPAVAALVAGLLVLAAGLAARPSGIRGAVPLLARGHGAILLALRVLAGPRGTAGRSPPRRLGTVDGGRGVRWLPAGRRPGRAAAAAGRAGAASGVGGARCPRSRRSAPATPWRSRGRLRPPPDDDGYGEYLRRTGAAGSLDASVRDRPGATCRSLAPADARCGR